MIIIIDYWRLGVPGTFFCIRILSILINHTVQNLHNIISMVVKAIKLCWFWRFYRQWSI